MDLGLFQIDHICFLTLLVQYIQAGNTLRSVAQHQRIKGRAVLFN
jgi:hypothetical protein